MASSGFIDTLWTPPSDQPWTIVQVTADDDGSPLHHYAFVYDGSNKLTVYRDKNADNAIDHTPTDSFKINELLYDGSETVTIYYAITIDDIAFDQSQIDSDYDNYFSDDGSVYGKSSSSLNALVSAIGSLLISASVTCAIASDAIVENMIEVDSSSSVYVVSSSEVSHELDITRSSTSENVSDITAIPTLISEIHGETDTSIQSDVSVTHLLISDIYGETDISIQLDVYADASKTILASSDSTIYSWFQAKCNLNDSGVVDLFNDGSGVALWPLDGNSSDLGGTYDGFNETDISWVTDGKFGGAAKFNGESSSIDVFDRSTTEDFVNKDFTYSLWVRASDSSTELHGMPFSIAYSTSSSTYPDEWEGCYVLFNDDKLRIGYMTTTDPYNYYDEFSVDFLNDNANFHNIIVSYDKDSNVLTYFIDGENRGSIQISGERGTHDYVLTSIGCGVRGDTDYNRVWFYTGLVDQVRFFNKPVTDAEAEQIYKEQYGLSIDASIESTVSVSCTLDVTGVSQTNINLEATVNSSVSESISRSSNCELNLGVSIAGNVFEGISCNASIISVCNAAHILSETLYGVSNSNISSSSSVSGSVILPLSSNCTIELSSSINVDSSISSIFYGSSISNIYMSVLSIGFVSINDNTYYPEIFLRSEIIQELQLISDIRSFE